MTALAPLAREIVSVPSTPPAMPSAKGRGFHALLAIELQRLEPMSLVRLGGRTNEMADASLLVSACQARGFRIACFHAGAAMTVLRGRDIFVEVK